MMSDAALREAYAGRATDAVAELNVEEVGRLWLDLLAGLQR
jgi:hypothetical protein